MSKFERLSYSPIKNERKILVLLFETLAMFAYVYALTCSRNSEEIEDQAIGSALLCVAILSRLNGVSRL